MLRFSAARSHIHHSFWSRLEDLKLNDWRLDDNSKIIRGYVSSLAPETHILSVSGSSFEAGDGDGSIGLDVQTPFQIPGIIKVVNTQEDFKAVDKDAFLSEAAAASLSMEGPRTPLVAAGTP